MAKTINADNVNWMADELTKDHPDDVWRTAAANHLRAAALFIRTAEQTEEHARLRAEAEAKKAKA